MIRWGAIVVGLVLLVVELYLFATGQLAAFFTIAAAFFLAIVIFAPPSRTRFVLALYGVAEGALALDHYGIERVGMIALPLILVALVLSIIDFVHRRRRPKFPLTDLRET